MFIKKSSIDAVLTEATILDVVQHYVVLDRNLKACCPFHDEKTPSFGISKQKNIYKCFGCGNGGSPVKFVQQHEKLTFIEAVKKVADICKIELEYEEPQNPDEYKRQQEEQDKLRATLQVAIELYNDMLWTINSSNPVATYLRKRQLKRSEIIEWQLGWSGDEWHWLSKVFEAKKLVPQAEQLGLIKKNEQGSYYDAYRNRIIIPIADRQGNYIGIAGRYVQPHDEPENKNIPKYINPPQSPLYNKSSIWYGLNRSLNGIKKKEYAIVVEGYFDVTTLHKSGDDNTLGSCGTAITEQQCKVLRQHCNRVLFMMDGDKAGIASMEKNLPVLLRYGFQTEVAALPNSHDPDSFFNALSTYENAPAADALGIKVNDGVWWQLERWLNDADGDDYKVAIVREKFVKLLANISNDIIRSNYFDIVCKKYKWNKSELQKVLKEKVEEKADVMDLDEETQALQNLPDWMNKDDLMTKGFCEVKTKKNLGYYSFDKSGKIELTNFLIKPLFHIYAGKDSRFMIEIDNKHKRAVLDIEAKAIVSIDLLQAYVVAEGAFIIYGGKGQMLRVANDLLQRFPLCHEVKFLGWQRSGFFAWANQVFVPTGGLYDLDQWGIFKLENENYLVPAASAAYSQLQRTEDDPYENDRVMEYVKSPIDFATWARQLQRVYHDAGSIGIAYIILCTFRDVVFSVDNNFPHLYAFGERSSGKSKFAESLLAFFYNKRPMFNLNSGTDFAFFGYMQRFRNCMAGLNEFDEKVIKPEWFQAIKGIYDGESRQRGSMQSRNKIEIQKVECGLMLIGQFLVTMDDNSVVSRSLIEPFSEREITEEDKQEYEQLKVWEAAGISSLVTTLLKHRDLFKNNFRNTVNETLSKWRKEYAGSEAFNQRIMQNWCFVFAAHKLLQEQLQLPLETDAMETLCYERAKKWSSFIRTSDTLSEFWNTFAFLIDQHELTEGWDFKIESLTSISLRNSKKETYTQAFDSPTKILYVRLNNVHKLYQSAYRQRTGKEGMTLDNLLHYFSSRKYYVGNSKQSRFRRFVLKSEEKKNELNEVTGVETKKEPESVITSSYCFLYSELGIEIERVSEEVAEIMSEPDTDLPF